jgi:hypothetical protein
MPKGGKGRPLRPELEAGDSTPGDIAEEEGVADPDRSLGEPQAAGRPLDRRIRRHDLPHDRLDNLQKLRHAASSI